MESSINNEIVKNIIEIINLETEQGAKGFIRLISAIRMHLLAYTYQYIIPNTHKGIMSLPPTAIPSLIKKALGKPVIW